MPVSEFFHSPTDAVGFYTFSLYTFGKPALLSDSRDVSQDLAEFSSTYTDLLVTSPHLWQGYRVPTTSSDVSQHSLTLNSAVSTVLP